ncbi:hypothetical protein AOLI_G00200500 [Acnodon oligacanthus]
MAARAMQRASQLERDLMRLTCCPASWRRSIIEVPLQPARPKAKANVARTGIEPATLALLAPRSNRLANRPSLASVFMQLSLMYILKTDPKMEVTLAFLSLILVQTSPRHGWRRCLLLYLDTRDVEFLIHCKCRISGFSSLPCSEEALKRKDNIDRADEGQPGHIS